MWISPRNLVMITFRRRQSGVDEDSLDALEREFICAFAAHVTLRFAVTSTCQRTKFL